MSEQLLTDEKAEEVRSIFETGDAWQVQQLVRIGFPGINAYEILRKRVQEQQDGPEIWVQLGYREERNKRPWLRNIFGRCGVCHAILLFSPHEAFSCGHLICQRRDASYCPICGPSFDQIWGFLRREEPNFSKIEWPATTDNLHHEIQLRYFAASVVKAHRTAIQQIRIETLVSFALHGSPSGVISFLTSYQDLVDKVKESRKDISKARAWEQAYRAAQGFQLLEQALETGLWAKSDQCNVLKATEDLLHAKTLVPIRECFRAYSLSEFLKCTSLLSYRLVRYGILNTELTIYNEINNEESSILAERWRERSRGVYLRYTLCLDNGREERGREVLQKWELKISNDIADICFVFPHLEQNFLELSKDLKSRGDFLSCGIIIVGLQDSLGQVATRSYLESLSMEGEGPEIPFELFLQPAWD